MINFLALGIFIYLGGAIFERTILFKLAYFFLLFHFIFKYYHYNIRKNFKIEHFLESDHLFYGEKLKTTIRAENKSLLPILWLRLEEFLPGRLTTLEEQHLSYFRPGEKKEWSFTLKAKKRGLYKMGPLRWEAGDFLGYDLTKAFLKELEFYIYPRILEIEELGLPSRLPFGNSKWPQPIYKDPYQNAGIREYQASDRMNKIHWKATAKTGELKSRKNESTVSIDTALILNFSQEDYGLRFLERKTELAVTAAASIAYYLNKAGQSFKFISNAVIEGERKEELAAYQNQLQKNDEEKAENQSGASESKVKSSDLKEKELENSAGDNQDAEEIDTFINLPAGSGDSHLQELLEILARVDITKADNFINLLTEEVDLAWGGTLIIFTEKDDQKLMQTVTNLMQRGYNVKIMIMGDQVFHKEYENRPFTAPLSIYHLRLERELNEI